MASAPQPTLPLFYTSLTPLNSQEHSKWRTRAADNAKWLCGQHAIPLTVDEFVQAQRNFPIVFSAGERPVPLALMGLSEGINTFVNADGKIDDPIYLPAYIRRYPFMLAKLKQDTDELSLCFDPNAESIGAFDEGEVLFGEDGAVTDATKRILEFCEQFEIAGQRTQLFADELVKHELLMDGEISIAHNNDPDKPFVYRGFKMVDQEKLKNVRGDQLRTWNQNGLMMLIHAHIFSLDLMRDIFARQTAQGVGPMGFTNPA